MCSSDNALSESSLSDLKKPDFLFFFQTKPSALKKPDFEKATFATLGPVTIRKDDSKSLCLQHGPRN